MAKKKNNDRLTQFKCRWGKHVTFFRVYWFDRLWTRCFMAQLGEICHRPPQKKVHHSADISSLRDPSLSSEEGGWPEPSPQLINSHAGSRRCRTRATNTSSLAATRPPSNDSNSNPAVIKPCPLCSFPQVFPAITDQCVSWSMCCCCCFVFKWHVDWWLLPPAPPLMTNTCLIDHVWELVPPLSILFFHTHKKKKSHSYFYVQMKHVDFSPIVLVVLGKKNPFFPNVKLKRRLISNVHVQILYSCKWSSSQIKNGHRSS